MTPSQPSGQAPQIKYFAVYSIDGGDAQIGIDDLTFNNPPAAKLVLATQKALDHEVLALDGSGLRSGNPITKYACDFDGDGHFDATCPGPMPVAYKLFDTSGVHNVALQVTDAIGHQSTSHTTITLGGKARRSIVRRAGTPSDLLHFWCG